MLGSVTMYKCMLNPRWSTSSSIIPGNTYNWWISSLLMPGRVGSSLSECILEPVSFFSPGQGPGAILNALFILVEVDGEDS